VSLPRDVYALYKAFAKVAGRSMSSMLAELAVTAAPGLEKVLRVAIAAKEAEQARKQGLQQAAAAADEQLSPLLQEAQRTLGIALENLEQIATQRPAGAQRAGARRRDPRPSNTGVRSPPNPGKKRRR